MDHKTFDANEFSNEFSKAMEAMKKAAKNANFSSGFHGPMFDYATFERMFQNKRDRR